MPRGILVCSDFSGESGLRKVGLYGIHPLTRRYASGGKMEKSIRELAKEVGLVIPKPEAKADFVIKGIGRRRGEEALIYRIPSHSEKAPFYEKGVTLSEFQLAYLHLRESGYLTRTWFNNNLSACAKEGECNFTTIGGVFCILGVAEYVSKATYQLKA